MIKTCERKICDWCEKQTEGTIQRGIACTVCQTNLISCIDCFAECHKLDDGGIDRIDSKYSLRVGAVNHQKMYHTSIELV